jgi:shikimate dehydrogenase
MIVRGTTRISQIIGHPIAQVRSPDLFNERLEALGIDAVLIPVDVSPEQLGNFIALQRGWHNSDGCVVTIPHKRPVVEHLDLLTARARRLQAVNVIRRNPDGSLIGDMVDGLGFMAAARKHGFTPQGRSALVIGTGGAGSAIVDALCDGGVARLALRDVDPARVTWMRDLFGAAFPVVELLGTCDDLSGFDLVVNASPVGMGGTGKLPIPEAQLKTLRPGTLVADVVTKPPLTPFLLAPRECGCRVQTGPEMAAGQIEILGRFLGVFT